MAKHMQRTAQIGMHVHALHHLPGYGTCLAPGQIVDAEDETGRPEWITVEFEDGTLHSFHHQGINDYVILDRLDACPACR